MRVPASLLVALAIVGIGISVKVVPSVFTVDDVNYLVNVVAVRSGGLRVSNTEGLTPSRELLFFDPTATTREVTSTPVASSAPALYGLLALPFSWFGWRGLVGLNTLAYLATVLIVFLYSQRFATTQLTPWLAAGAFALGGFALEYSQGVWPHALSFALCTGGIVAAGMSIDRGRHVAAVAAGVLLATAAGLRYQNAVIVAAVGAGLLLLAQDRLRAVAAFAAGTAVPLSTSAFINHVRLDSWNPISKGSGYLNVPLAVDSSAWSDPFVMLWAQTVDYSARPRLSGPDVDSWLHYDLTTGAHLILNAFAKCHQAQE